MVDDNTAAEAEVDTSTVLSAEAGTASALKTRKPRKKVTQQASGLSYVLSQSVLHSCCRSQSHKLHSKPTKQQLLKLPQAVLKSRLTGSGRATLAQREAVSLSRKLLQVEHASMFPFALLAAACSHATRPRSKPVLAGHAQL